MKNIKSKILFGVAALMSVLCLPSCGGSAAKPNFEVPEGGYDGSAVTITLQTTQGERVKPYTDAAIEEFNKLYPNITVVHDTSIGDYDDLRDDIQTEISIGEQPNIAYCYPDHVAMYNKAKAVVTLDNLINDPELGLSDEQIEDFIGGYYDEGRQFGDGLMYTLPFFKSTEVLYYDKTFFVEHNLTVPTTWEEMETVCRAIKAIDPNSIPLGYDSEANWFITMCEQLGAPYTSAEAPHFLFDNEETKEFVNEFKSWYDEGLVTTQSLFGSYTSGLFTKTTAGETRSYMSIGSSAGATYQRPTKEDGATDYPFEVGIASIPQADVNNKKVISQGPSACIFKSENPQEVVASWLLLKYLTTNVEYQAEYALGSGYMPVLKSVMQNPTFAARMELADGGDHIAELSMKVSMEQADYYFVSPAFIGSSTARDEVGALIPAAFTAEDEAAFNKAFRDAIEECEYQAG